MKQLLLKAFLIVFAVGLFTGSATASPKINLKNFPNAALQQQAAVFFQELKKQYAEKTNPSDLSDLQIICSQLKIREALANKHTYNWSKTDECLESLLTHGHDDYQTWLLYALSLQAYSPTSSLRVKTLYQQQFVFAATQAYSAAKTPHEKAVVLWLVGEVFADKQLKNRATKILAKSKIQEKLREAIATYPNILAPYEMTVKEKTATGQVCIKWTHPLNRHANNMKDFIEVTPNVKDLGVSVQGAEFCLQGLEFGKSYEITLKPGLPGIRDLKLQTTETLAAYIPDRQSMVAFREHGYVLPQKGPKILPLTTINVDKVKVQVFSVPNRNLSQALNSGKFLSQIDRWDRKKLKTQEAERLWQGTFEIVQKANYPVTTGLPLEQMLKSDLKPGLYVVQATQDEGEQERWNTPKATQWFVISDLGLSTITGPDGLHILVRSLQSATPRRGVVVSLVARNNRILQKQTTDRNGYARFEPSLIAGIGGNSPLFIQAVTSDASDFSLLNLNTSAHDMTDRGDKGRVLTKGPDAFLYAERDLYRPGEEVNVVALLRDQKGQAISNVPIVFKVKRPDGVEVLRKIVADEGAGAHKLKIPTSPTSRTGEWTILAYVDVNSAPIGRFEFKLNDFVPPQIEVKLKNDKKLLTPHSKMQLGVEASYLFGAPAQSLKVEGSLNLRQAKQPFTQWKAYCFGLEEKSWQSKRIALLKSKTDTNGKVQLNTELPSAPETTHILEVHAGVTVHEISGRPRTVKQSIPFWHQKFAIGIAPQFKDKVAPYRGMARFSVIAVNAKGILQNVPQAAYKLYRENVEYAWFKEGARWKYEAIVTDEVIAEGNIRLHAKKPASLKAQVKGGRYRLEVYDLDANVASSIRFRAGWGSDFTGKRPDKIDLTTDKKSYKPGDKVEVFVKPPYAGQLVIYTAGQRMHPVYTGAILKKGKAFTFPLPQNLANGAGTYLYATVFRPFDAKRKQKADRAIGLHWLDFDTSDAHLPIELIVPEKSHPNKTLESEVKLSGIKEPTYLTVIAVDDGVLQLTNFAPPDPLKYYFSQKALAYQIRDVYGQLINPDNTKPGSFRVGGDGGETISRSLAELPIKSTKIVSLFSGLVQADAQGMARVPLQIPEFAGRLKVMAVAWNKTQMGSVSKPIKVHDDVVVQVTVPRFLAKGDEADLMVQLLNQEGAPGAYKLKVDFAEAFAELESLNFEFELERKQQLQKPIQIKASQMGVGKLLLTLTAPDGQEIQRHFEIGIRHAAVPVTKKVNRYLQPGETTTFSIKPNMTNVHLQAGANPFFARFDLIQGLRDYPYRCLEQTTSRALAFLASLRLKSGAKQTRDRKAVQQAIRRIFSYQRIDGSFGMWSSYHNSELWLTAYSSDMLLQAKQQGFALPEVSFKAMIRWFKQQLSRSPRSEESATYHAYYHYLLAKSRQGDFSKLRYFGSFHRNLLQNPSSAAFMGASFAYYGDFKQAHHWFEKARTLLQSSPIQIDVLGDNDFGPAQFCDLARLTTLMSETTQDDPKLPELVAQLVDVSNSLEYLSTYEKAWLLRVGNALSQDGEALDVRLRNQPLPVKVADVSNDLYVTNHGAQGAWVTMTMHVHPKPIKKKVANGLSISREILTLAGEKVAKHQYKQGELYVVRLTGELQATNAPHTLIVDYLPAGFEIENAIVKGGDFGPSLSWLGDRLSSLTYFEARDDRFVAVMQLSTRQDFTVVYLVRAVTPGQFVYPACRVENMYLPSVFGQGFAHKVQVVR
ncbi:MAG: alpha-2-macroglobulin [Pseudomonadota bacterium]